MGYYLKIYDVSPLIYAGQLGLSKGGYTALANTASNGIPVGGLRYALRRCITDMFRGNDVLFVFDSKTDKNQYFDGYKSNRTRNPEIYVQQMIFEDIIRGCNLPYLKKDGYEADDLVAYAMSKIKFQYNHIMIVTSDMDLAGNLCVPGAEIEGSSSNVPSITKDNFETTVKSNQLIEYNLILPYFIFFGKPSNNVKAFRDKATNVKLLQDFKEFCISKGIAEGNRSLLNTFAQWLQFCNQNQTLSNDDIVELLNRTKFIYPKPLADAIPFDTEQCRDKVNKERLAFFLKTLNLDSMINDFDLQDFVPASKTREMFAYLDTYKDIYTQGVLAVDAGSTPDMSHFSSGDTTAVFVNEEDF